MNIITLTEIHLKRITDAKENFLQKILKPLPSWLNADQLTLIRILCILPAIFFILYERTDFALLVFVFGALLDLIDGPIARLRKKETDIGRILDPFADKILAAGILITLCYKNPLLLSSFLFWSILVLEFILVCLLIIGKQIMRQVGIKRKLGANLWGKWKFFLQTIGISLLLLKRPILAQFFLWPSVVLAAASIISHTFKEPEKI